MTAHFLWDTIYLHYKGILDFGNLLHLFMGGLVYGSGLLFQHNLYLGLLHFVPGEATNAAMHLREILKRLGLRYSLSYYANEYYYCYAYMICRGLFIPCVYYFWYSCESTGPIFLVFYPVHIVQSWYYVSQLPKMIRWRNAERDKFKKAKVTLKGFVGVSEGEAKEAGIGANKEAYKM